MIKPLLKEEVARKLWKWIDWNSQSIHPQRKMMINVTCPVCHEERRREVARIRLDSKKNTWTGMCTACCGKAKIPNHKGRRGNQHPAWTGGRSITSGGYVLMSIENYPAERHLILEKMLRPGRREILEHRAVVALALGKPLRPNQHIHHINKNRTDNRLENLQLVDHHKRPICPKCAVDSPTIADCVVCDL